MNRSFTSFTISALFAPLCFTLTACGEAQAPDAASPAPETKTMDELYKDAVAEGGKLVIYAGGDSKTTYDYLKDAFKKRFPGVDIEIKVDLSKYHDDKIDDQLAKGELEPDIAYLQTLQDFDRWKSEGALLPYKPIGFEQVYPEFKDPDGAFVGLAVVAFTNLVNTKMVSEEKAPRDAADYLDPQYKGKLVFTYPNDDDAVLFEFAEIVEKYGWEYMDKLKAQEPLYVRGTDRAFGMVAMGDKVATFTAAGPLAPMPGLDAKLMLPKTDSFLSWPQTAAIFKSARHPAAAKLFLSWSLADEPQKSLLWQWPVRADLPAPGGYEQVFEYNTSPERFRAFMRDRKRVEEFKAKIEQYVGPVTGPSPLDG